MYYYVKNLLGDIVQITKQDGTVVAKYIYDVWGKILSIKDGSNNTIETTNATHLANLNPFRYRGYVYDNETGLYYLQSRYYDPITGRFLNADVYADTGNSVISTNMFAYCENNAVMKYDVTGKDAWWIQSPSSAGDKGHTSLLIQEKPGFWWYFYWGPESIQLIFLGTIQQKNLNTALNNIIKGLNPKSNPNLVKYTDKYTKSLRFSGNFKASYDYAKSIINNYYNKYKPKKLEMRCDHSGKKSDYYKGNKYSRPYSKIIVGNKEYDWYNPSHIMNNNCMHKSIDVLYKGSLEPFQIKFYTVLQGIKKYNFYPNNGYGKLLKYNRQYHFGKEVITG